MTPRSDRRRNLLAREHVFSQVVAAPLDEVFEWHTRPGALVRLSPPWIPATVAAEADSLRDGRAVLAFPGGLRWIAQHDPAAYRPPEHFADALATPVLGGLLPWRHTHELTAVDAGATRITDRINTPVPSMLLRPILAYRHRQISGDLLAHRRLRGFRAEPLTIAVTGSTGLVGSALCAFLEGGGHRVIRLVRRRAATGDERTWEPADPHPGLLRGVDALVHLAGASIAGRFTRAHKAAIRESRIDPTRRLAELAASTLDGPGVIVAASAIGYYGPDRDDEILTEDSPRGEGFLADVVSDWEAATAPAADGGVRVVTVRTGIVQSPRGGMLRLLLPLAEVGAAGAIGGGRQWMSWIGIDDLVDIYARALVDDTLTGPFNATAPEPVRNATYAKTLGKVVTRPLQVPVPAVGPRLLLGAEGAHEVAQASQRVVPQRLVDAGQEFRHSSLEPALRHLLGRTRFTLSAGAKR